MPQIPAHREAIYLQRIMASVFLVLGAWCLIAPESVIMLTVREPYRDTSLVTLVAMGAFGAQAMLSGLFAAFSVFTRRTFLAFGISVLPFFVFNWWFCAKVPLFNGLILLDTLGNIIFLSMCVRGWIVLSPKSQSAKASAL